MSVTETMPAVPAPNPIRSRERHLDLAAATEQLARAVSAPSSLPLWRPSVNGAVEDVRAAFERHVAMEDLGDGLHEEVVRRAPRLSHAASQLRAEHGRIRTAIDAVAYAMTVDRGSLGPRHACETLVAMMRRHHARTADLVVEAFEADIGSGG